MVGSFIGNINCMLYIFTSVWVLCTPNTGSGRGNGDESGNEMDETENNGPQTPTVLSSGTLFTTDKPDGANCGVITIECNMQYSTSH